MKTIARKYHIIKKAYALYQSRNYGLGIAAALKKAAEFEKCKAQLRAHNCQINPMHANAIQLIRQAVPKIV